MGKARRRGTAAGDGGGAAGGAGGGGGGGSSSAEQHKLYLEEAVLERRHSDTDLRQLVDLPPGLGYNEWLASHTVDFFQHINLIYGTISEFCTSSSCPDMIGPCQRQYVWSDERSRKVRTTAPQYVDYVMTFIQKVINDEAIFPSRLANEFPNEFESVVRRVFQLLFHVIAHIYHNHFRELMLLTLHAHLNCVFAHFTLFNERFKLIEERETDVLRDLVAALKLGPVSCSASASASACSSLTAAASAAATGGGCGGTADARLCLPAESADGAGDDIRDTTGHATCTGTAASPAHATATAGGGGAGGAGDVSVGGCGTPDRAGGDGIVITTLVTSSGHSTNH